MKITNHTIFTENKEGKWAYIVNKTMLSTNFNTLVEAQDDEHKNYHKLGTCEYFWRTPKGKLEVSQILCPF